LDIEKCAHTWSRL